MQTGHFSTELYRAFTVQSSLPYGKHVPTGYLTDAIKRGGHPYGRNTRLKPREDDMYSAAKMAEECREILDILTALSTTPQFTNKRQELDLLLAAEIGNLKAAIEYIRSIYRRLPPASRHAPSVADAEIFKKLSSRWDNIARFVADPQNTDKDTADMIKEQVVHTEGLIYRFFVLPSTRIHLSDVDHAMAAKRQAFGIHEGWALRAMVLPITDDLCTKLAANKGWEEADLEDFAIDAALTIDRIKAITPPG